MKQHLLFILYFLCFSGVSVQAQVLYTEPVFPTVDDEVTIFFDATQGTGELAGCNCTVYIHTGVITTASSSPTDWKHVAMSWGVANSDWALTPVAGTPDLYSFTISPSIQDYYNIGASEVVSEMAFVFRNADGSLTGKADGGADIYYPVYPEDFPFTTVLVSPGSNSILTNVGETIQIKAATSEEATLQIFDNGVQLANTTGRQIEYGLEVTEGGTHVVEIITSNGTDTDNLSFSYIVPIDIEAEDPPEGIEHGITFFGDTSVYLSLYAPEKENVFVIGDFTDWALNTDYQMMKSLDGNTYWLHVFGLTPGQNYTFQYLIDGDLKIADPYSTVVLHETQDAFIPEITYPDLPPYPSGKTSGYVSLIQPGATPYEWQSNDYERPDEKRMVVYELLMRDFIERHDYKTLIDTLDYLERLGINAIELMPVNEFDGNISWGYNPVFHQALDKYYGTIEDFKRLIDECHSRNIAVILDVVYNQAHETSPLVQLYTGTPNVANNPYFNLEATHPFNVFTDLNHESPATRLFVKKTLKYWQEEFRIDGFRFDLSKGFTQVDYGDNVGAWGQYDASRVAILKDYSDAVWATDPNAYVIMEHFGGLQEETEMTDYGMMTWGNMNHNYNEATMGYSGNSLSGVTHYSRSWDEPRLMGFMESHDEERMMYKNLEFGNNNGLDYFITNPTTALRRQELASAFLYTLPGPKMLWQFGEVGYDINIDFNGRTGPKPILWEYYEEPERRRLYDVTRSLIQLRNNYEVFHSDDVDLKIGAGSFSKVKYIYLTDDEMNVTVIGNFDVTDHTAIPDFQHTGTWYEYFSGDTFEATGTDTIPLTHGEYRLYTDVPLPAPPMGHISTVNTEKIVNQVFQLSTFPNPTNAAVQISYQLEHTEQVQLELYNVLGQKVETLVNERQQLGQHQITYQKHLQTGTYILKLTVGNQIEMEQLVVL